MATLPATTPSKQLRDLLEQDELDDLRAATGIWRWTLLGMVAWIVAGVVMVL